MSMFTKTKIKAFNTGSMNLVAAPTKKEEEESKKRLDEQQAKEVYEEFVATFQDTPTSKVNKTWVKGGTVNPGAATSNTDEAGKLYKPTSKYSEKVVELKKKEIERERQQDERRMHGLKPALPGKSREKEKKKSNLEIFKEELKMIQQEREQRHHTKRGGSRNSIPDFPDPADVAVKRSRFESQESDRGSRVPGGGGGGGTPAQRSIGGGIAPPNDLDYPYDIDTDKSTTNLFLGNLNPAMTETQLCEIFGHFGPLASVKVMWPRTDEERARSRNCGFVAFMNRKDGERALDKLKGRDIMSFEMKLGWGKSVPIPAHPYYVPPSLMELIKPPPPSNLPFNAQPRDWLRSIRTELKNRTRGLMTRSESTLDRKPFNVDKMSDRELDETLRNAVVKVVIPTERSTLSLINRMVEFVVREGPLFEAIVMNKEINNPQYKFLFDYASSEHTYYRWKLFSILHGDSSHRWRLEEFQMYRSGPMWRPPPMDIYTSGMPDDLIDDEEYAYAPGYTPTDDVKDMKEENKRHSDEDGDRSNGAHVSGRTGLSDSQRERLEGQIRDLDPDRRSIGSVMCWCLEHADAADDIVEALANSLAVLQTPLNKKLARIFLVSDILFNSSAKVAHASFFRRAFETRLVEIFNDLNEYMQEFDSRFKAEQFKQKVMLCFRAWEDWAVYPNEFLIKLQNIFLGLVQQEEDLPLVDSPPNIDEVLDGKPLVDYDGDPLDIDGAPLEGNKEDDDDWDGEPLNSSSNRKSRSRSSSPSRSKGAHFVPSKWESVDPQAEVQKELSRWEVDDESEEIGNGVKFRKREVSESSSDDSGSDNREDGELDDDVDGKPLVSYNDDDDGSVSSGPRQSSKSHSDGASHLARERRRAKLRDIEVKVMKYQDELENNRKGNKSSIGNISQLVERYRQRLMTEIDEESDPKSSSLPSSKKKRASSKDSSQSRESSAKRSSSSKRGGSSKSPVKERRREKSPVEKKKSSESSSSRKVMTKERRRSRSKSKESRDRISSEVHRRRTRSRSPQIRSSSSSRHKSSTKRK